MSEYSMQATSQKPMTTWSYGHCFYVEVIDPVVCQESDTFTNKPKLRFLMHS